MAVTPQSLINRAYRLAVGMGQDPHQSVAIDNVWAFEEAFPLALNDAVEEIGYSADEIEHYRRQFTLVFADGMTAMPQDIMHDLLDQSTVMSVSSDTETIDSETLSSWCNRFSEFMNPPHPTALHYYTTANNKFYFRVAGGEPLTFVGEVELFTPAVPAVPAVITDTILIPDDIADRTVELLAEMIRGKGASG